MKLSRKLIVITVSLLMVLAICGCGSKKDTKTAKSDKSSSKVAANQDSLYEYAKKLEKAGNSEAAAAVYELIPKGDSAEFNNKAHNEIPAVKYADETEQIEEIFDNTKGGNGK